MHASFACGYTEAVRPLWGLLVFIVMEVYENRTPSRWIQRHYKKHRLIMASTPPRGWSFYYTVLGIFDFIPMMKADIGTMLLSDRTRENWICACRAHGWPGHTEGRSDFAPLVVVIEDAEAAEDSGSVVSDAADGQKGTV